MTPVSRYLLAAIAASSLFLSGCGAGFQAGPVTSPLGVMQGRVHGGQPPISGSNIYLFAASTSAYAGPGIAANGTPSSSAGTSPVNASISLLGASSSGNPTTYADTNGNYYVTSDSNGNFSIGGDYTCVAGQQVYAYAVGGDAGGGANSGIGMLAILGTCPASGNLASTVPFIWMNEVTTIAAAYAMSGFASDATHVSTGGSALAATGITNAFATAANMVNVATGTAYATTPNGNGTVPQTKIDTLANILAACVNSTDSVFANCTTLFGAATGAVNATTPTDTATAAINIAHSPATNVTTLTGLVTGIATPFVPNLGSTVPSDLTLSLIFTGGGLTTGINSTSNFGLAAHALTADASGNIWLAGYYGGNVLSEFSPLGVPAATAGFTNSCLTFPATAVLDSASANIWVTTPLVTSSTAGTTLCEYNIAGNSWTTVTPVSGSTKELNEPEDVGIDPSGNLFVSSANNESVVKLTSAGVYTTTTKNTSYVYYPFGIAFEPGGTFWLAGQGSGTTKKYADLWTDADAYSAEITTDYYFSAVALIDASGNAWIPSNQTGMTKTSATGSGTTQIAYTKQSGNPYMASGVIDGAGNVWLTDYYNGLITEYNNSGSLVSAHGYVPAGEPNNYLPPAAPTTGYIQPAYITVDGSGNVWSTELGVAAIQEMVGAAVPVANPLSYAVANSLLGTRP